MPKKHVVLNSKPHELLKLISSKKKEQGEASGLALIVEKLIQTEAEKLGLSL